MSHWTRTHSSGVLEEWLAEQGFEPQRPPGADLQPGTVLFVSGASDYVALSAAEFAGDQTHFIQSSMPRAQQLLSALVGGTAEERNSRENRATSCLALDAQVGIAKNNHLPS